MIALTLRLCFCLLLLALLPVRVWACAAVAGPEPAVAARHTSAVSLPVAERGTPPGLAVGALPCKPEAQHTASCDSCQSCPQCHTPGAALGSRPGLSQTSPQSPLTAVASPFSSTAPTPQLKPPIS